MRSRGWGGGGSPEWWPEGEVWPPGRDGQGPGMPRAARRFVRYLIGFVLLVLVLPIAIGLVLAATIGGWTSVAVAVVSWIGLVVVVAVAGRLVWRGVGPIRALVAGTERLAEGEYDTRVSIAVAAPFRPLAQSFNTMAERLETADDLRRQLLADVSHELRTPLTVLRGELEAMIDGVHELDEEHVRILLVDVEVIERLLDDLRTLSSAEAGVLTLHRELTDMNELARDTVERFQGETAQRDVVLTFDQRSGQSVVEADVDPVRIGEVLSNLITNALRATAEGGRVTIGSRIDRTGGSASFVYEVADSGTGINPSEIDRVFDRFHKGAGSTGSGLGLTISRDLVHAHGGSIDMTSEQGQGTIVEVALPLPDPSS